MLPSSNITWFQAQQALANSDKQLPTSAQWQAAVAGAPDSTTCNVSTGNVEKTGAETGCVSSWGVNDMVGNLWEWTADWTQQADGCDNLPATYGSDFTCFGDSTPATPNRRPGALLRGGYFNSGPGAGPYAVTAGDDPSRSSTLVGFRGVR